MKAKYPNLWEERNGSNFCDDNGEFTPIAKNWLGELLNVTGEQIKIGLRDLSLRKNASFPPTAIEFVAHCREMGAEDCVDEILDYINQPTETKWWWKSQVAFNVFKRLYYNNLGSEDSVSVKKRILEIYRKLNMNSLDPLPPKPIALPIKEPSKVDRDRGKFQGKMFFAIMRARPDLLGIEQDSKTVSLFTPHKSNELMVDWYNQSQPDMCQFLRTHGIAV